MATIELHPVPLPEKPLLDRSQLHLIDLHAQIGHQLSCGDVKRLLSDLRYYQDLVAAMNQQLIQFAQELENG